MIWNVLYTCNGERHRVSVDYREKGAAGRACKELRQDGWKAWVERVK